MSGFGLRNNEMEGVLYDVEGELKVVSDLGACYEVFKSKIVVRGRDCHEVFEREPLDEFRNLVGERVGAQLRWLEESVIAYNVEKIDEDDLAPAAK